MAAVYRVAVIGTGFAERVQIPGFQRHPRFEVVALAARDPEKTEEVAHRFGIERWYSEWRQMIEKGGFDVVSITPPPHLHHQMALAAFDAGAHVLCEKPMALNAMQAREMLDRAVESGRTAMIDHEFRYLAVRQRFEELLKEGYAGDVQRLVINFHGGWRAGNKHDWNWWSDFERGGGLLGALGSHYFDAACHWLQRRPLRVWGKLNTFVRERRDPASGNMRAVTADDAFLATLDLGDGREVLFDFLSTAQPHGGSRVTAFGSEGTLVMEDDRRLLGARGDDELQSLELEELPRQEGEEWLLAPFLRLLDRFAAGIDEGTSPSPSFEDGLAHQQFIDSVKISHVLDCWVDLPFDGSIPEGALPQINE
jgi:predicted dehydrogenase